MKNIGFINTPIYNNDEGIFPPLGIISIATYIRDKKEKKVRVYDLALMLYSKEHRYEEAINETVEAIKKDKIELLGINCQNFSLAAAILLAKEVKEACPMIPIFLGGVGTHGLAEILLEKFGFIEYIVMGEGEQTVCDLIDALENKNLMEVKGVFFRKNCKIVYNGNHALIEDLKSVPMPDFSLIKNVERYFTLFSDSKRALNVELARGCSGGCAFCGCFSFWCGRHRYFDIDKVFQQISFLVDKYRINHVYLSDDNFLSNRELVEVVCTEFKKRNLKITWDSRGRVNNMDPEILKKMHEAGCSEILIGIESSDDEVLKKMNKRIHSDQQFNAVKNVMDAGIYPILSLILGYEGESEIGINKTLLFLLKLYREEKPMVSYFHILTIVPGTRLYENKKKNICTKAIDDTLNRLFYGDDCIPEEEKKLIREYPELFSTFYYIPNDMKYSTLRTISDLSTIVLRVFCFTLSALELRDISIFSVFASYSDKYPIFDGNEVSMVNQFSNLIFENWGDDILIKNLLIHEMIIYKLSNSQGDMDIDMEYDINIILCKKEIKEYMKVESGINKCKYRYRKNSEGIKMYSIDKS